LASFVVSVSIAVGAQLLLKGHGPDWLGLSVATAILVGLYVAGNYWIERREPVELETRRMPQTAIGLGIGLAAFTSVIAILAAAGVYRMTGRNAAVGLASGLLLAIVEAVLEEVIFRGFLFRLFAAAGGNWAAIVLTSALFGLAHRANPNATLASSAAIAVEAGVLLGAAYAASGNLWLPIGIHAGWNFAEGWIFGMAVSGNSFANGLVAGKLQGPVILTGGAFGPEASIAAVVVCLVTASFFLVRMRRQV
jgi:membrane protease YdiL (CAAX protease family)